MQTPLHVLKRPFHVDSLPISVTINGCILNRLKRKLVIKTFTVSQLENIRGCTFMQSYTSCIHVTCRIQLKRLLMVKQRVLCAKRNQIRVHIRHKKMLSERVPSVKWDQSACVEPLHCNSKFHARHNNKAELVKTPPPGTIRQQNTCTKHWQNYNSYKKGWHRSISFTHLLTSESTCYCCGWLLTGELA